MANLAHVYLGSDRPELALPLLETVARDWTEQPGYILELAQCCFKLGHTERARLLLEDLKGRPELASRADILQGELAFGMGDTAAALEHLRRAAAAAEGSRLPTRHLQIGDACLKERQWEDARRAFERAVAIEVDCAEAHHGLAIVAWHQRRNADAAERAVQAFRTCLSIQPGVIAAHRGLAVIHRAQGKGGADRERAAQHRLWVGQLLARRQREERAKVTASAEPVAARRR